jgi:hypothetical protein
LVDGFGFVTAFTSDLIEAGANFFNIAWNSNQNNQAKFTFTNTGVGAETLDVLVYFANPGDPSKYARKNSG